MKKILFLVLFAAIHSGFAQSSSFSYQGRLSENGTPANGNYDFQFVLHTSDSGSSQVGDALTNANVSVVDGVFSASVDFGVDAFDGGPRFLEIQVRTNGSSGAFAP